MTALRTEQPRAERAQAARQLHLHALHRDPHDRRDLRMTELVAPSQVHDHAAPFGQRLDRRADASTEVVALECVIRRFGRLREANGIRRNSRRAPSHAPPPDASADSALDSAVPRTGSREAIR